MSVVILTTACILDPGGRKRAPRAAAGTQGRAARGGGSFGPIGGSLPIPFVEISPSVHPPQPMNRDSSAGKPHHSTGMRFPDVPDAWDRP